MRSYAPVSCIWSEMSENQDQQLQTTTEQPTSYLASVPSAHSFMQCQQADESAVIATQSGELVEQLQSLSVQNPSVTVKLSAPLSPKLFNELVEKGYSVTKSSNFQSVNGQRTESHSVTVALPQSHWDMPRTPMFRPLLSRFWYPFW